MTTPQQIEQAIAKTKDEKSFIRELLQGALNWPVPESIETLDDISYDWSADELRAKGLSDKLVAGTVKQIRLADHQPWGIFLLEFNNEDAFTTGSGLAGPLRAVLRGLVPSRRQAGNLPSFGRENLLFICTHAYKHYRFAYFKAPLHGEKTAPLAAFGWSPGEPCRTACELNLPDLAWPETPAAWVAKWADAFSVEKVTKAFYSEYATVFEGVKQQIGASGEIEGDQLHLFTQTLMNRLMFLRFIERKGWLTFDGRKDYLQAICQTAGIDGASLYNSRLRKMFFDGLALEKSARPPGTEQIIGDVPFLNGGLFECNDTDRKVRDIPDAAFNSMVGLFYRFNFTVEESTPLDIEVAVDPEMLGKVFEELVTGRHETGSYYTPRPIVAFMCRESLKGYLQTHTKASAGALASLIDEHEVDGLTTADGSSILNALDNLKAVDPACGSGAYLLGLMQEMLVLYRLLYSEKLVQDDRSLYALKLHIISRSLYGVDIDPFATSTAMLRLWLSLTVEGKDPLPLPNLDFKIETGDSLTGPCELSSYRINTLGLQARAEILANLKDQYMNDHSRDKGLLRAAILKEEKAIGFDLVALRGKGVIDWRIQFVEAFARDKKRDEGNGFDIVLANPPYVRQELIRNQKPVLKEIYPSVYTGTADLYCYFYARAVQLLRSGGMLAFISSNKWFRAGYGQKLRGYIAARCDVRSITDFGSLPVFEGATAYPMIFIAKKASGPSRAVHTVAASLAPPYPDVRALTLSQGATLSDKAIDGDSWQLAGMDAASCMAQMRAKGIPLSEYIGNRMYFGIKTAFNKAFVLDQATRDRLIHEHARTADLLKHLVLGRDVNRWSVDDTHRWLLVARIGVDMNRYPAAFAHLRQWEQKLRLREDQGEHWWELRPCAYYDAFEHPKIMWGNMGLAPRFTLVPPGIYTVAPANIIASEDLYLLGVLNSSFAGRFFAEISAQRGGAYLEFKPMYVKQLPVPTATSSEREAIKKLVQNCLDAKGQNCEVWEKEIDERVAALYGL